MTNIAKWLELSKEWIASSDRYWIVIYKFCTLMTVLRSAFLAESAVRLETYPRSLLCTVSARS